MEFIKRVLNKFFSIFKSNDNLLPEGEIVNENIPIIENINEINDKSLKEQSTTEDETVYNEEIIIPSKYTKEQFFTMYNNYKEGKIDKKYLLVTDLIAIELMLQKESEEYDKRIGKEQSIVNTQLSKLRELETKKSTLEQKFAMQNNN